MNEDKMVGVEYIPSYQECTMVGLEPLPSYEECIMVGSKSLAIEHDATVVMCSCGVNPASEPDQCPHAFEIYGDESPCTCCENCRDWCAVSI